MVARTSHTTRRIRLQTRCADSSVYSPPVSPPTLSLLTAADRTLVFHSEPPSLPARFFPARFLSSPCFRVSPFPGGENRSAAWVDLSGAVAIKNSPVSGAWIADGTTAAATPHRFRSSWLASNQLDPRERGRRRECNPVAFLLREIFVKGTNIPWRDEFAFGENWRRVIFWILA